MNLRDLETELDKALTDFSDETRLLFPEGKNLPVDNRDISDLSKQTFYALNEFKKSILKYLKDI